MTDLPVVRRVAEETSVRAAREMVRSAPKSGLLPQPVWVMGTTAGSSAPGATAWVLIDGDDQLGGSPIPVENETGTPVADGARVRVRFRPTGGASIVGYAGSSATGVTSVVLSADTSPISLAVPAGANDVEVRASLRSNVAALTDVVAVRFNSDTASSYLSAYLYHSGTTPKAGTEADVGRFPAGQCHGNTAAAGLFSACRIDAVDVANATAHKEGTADVAVAGTLRVTTGWRWPKVDAVTLIELRPWNGTLWKSGSSARLYAR